MLLLWSSLLLSLQAMVMHRLTKKHATFCFFVSDCSRARAVTCVNDDPVCFASDETLCGRTEFSTLWTLSNAIATSFNTCVDLTQPPYPASVTVGADIPSPLCVLIEPVENQEGDLEYSSCVASMGGTNCAQCDICESGLGVKFDCSNINIQPNAPAKVDGPVADVICLDVSLGPEDEGSKDD